MSKHRLWETDECVERFTEEFGEGLAELDEVLAASRQALADLDRLVAA